MTLRNRPPDLDPANQISHGDPSYTIDPIWGLYTIDPTRSQWRLRWEGATPTRSHIGILKRLLATFIHQWVSVKRSCWPCIRWCGSGGFQEQGQYFFVLQAAPSLVALYCFPLLFFLSIGVYCGAVVVGLIGCKLLTPCLALPTSFNNYNNNNNEDPTQLIDPTHGYLICYISFPAFHTCHKRTCIDQNVNILDQDKFENLLSVSSVI